MSTSTLVVDTNAAPPRPTSCGSWWRCRTELGFAAGVLAIAAFMTHQTVYMEVPEGAGTPGPQFVPALVTLFLVVTGVLLAIGVIRNPRHTHPTSSAGHLSTDMLADLAAIDDAGLINLDHPSTAARSDLPPGSADAGSEPAGGSDHLPVDYRTVGLVLGGLVGFALLLEPVGWLITAAALFWLVSYALGSRRRLFDIAVSVIVASVIQIAFSSGLGLSLPPGILEGVLPWNN